MKIKFCGASSGVTGSCHLLSTENHKILFRLRSVSGRKSAGGAEQRAVSF